MKLQEAGDETARAPAAGLPTQSGGRRRSPVRAAIYVVLTLGAALSLVPFVYMLMTSVKSYGSLITGNLWPWPPFGSETLQWQNYPDAIRAIGWDNDWQMFLFFRYALNSIIVGGAIVMGTLVTSILAAYAFAQMRIPGKNVLFMLLLATVMIPADLTVVPKAVMMYELKNPFGPGSWYNTYLALTVPFLASVFGIFLLRQFFLQIPKELFDAALIDGCGHLRYLFTIVVPIARPAIVSVAMLNFLWSWDSFKWPLLVTRDNSMRVLAVGLQQFLVGEGGTNTQLMMAFSAMVIVPVIVFYFFTQRYFTEGIATTGIKG
jgi:ABC-type glycerol-3-phosphate transport system permease component